VLDEEEEYAGEARRGIDNEASDNDPQLSTSQASDWVRTEGRFRQRIPTTNCFTIQWSSWSVFKESYRHECSRVLFAAADERGARYCGAANKPVLSCLLR